RLRSLGRLPADLPADVQGAVRGGRGDLVPDVLELLRVADHDHHLPGAVPDPAVPGLVPFGTLLRAGDARGRLGAGCGPRGAGLAGVPAADHGHHQDGRAEVSNEECHRGAPVPSPARPRTPRVGTCPCPSAVSVPATGRWAPRAVCGSGSCTPAATTAGSCPGRSSPGAPRSGSRR